MASRTAFEKMQNAGFLLAKDLHLTPRQVFKVDKRTAEEDEDEDEDCAMVVAMWAVLK